MSAPKSLAAEIRRVERSNEALTKEHGDDARPLVSQRSEAIHRAKEAEQSGDQAAIDRALVELGQIGGMSGGWQIVAAGAVLVLLPVLFGLLTAYWPRPDTRPCRSYSILRAAHWTVNGWIAKCPTCDKTHRLGDDYDAGPQRPPC